MKKSYFSFTEVFLEECVQVWIIFGAKEVDRVEADIVDAIAFGEGNGAKELFGAAIVDGMN